MKHLNIVVYLIVAAAVLIAAYGVGLLVRQARQERTQPVSGSSIDPNETTELDPIAASRRINQEDQELTEEQKAALKQKRAEQLAKMKNMTEEEKQKFRDAVQRQVTATNERTTPRGVRLPSARRTARPQTAPSRGAVVDSNTPAPNEPEGQQ